MATNLVSPDQTAIQTDHSAEVAEWIEAFDDLVAADWQHSAEILAALRQRAREAGVPAPDRAHHALPQHHPQA